MVCGRNVEEFETLGGKALKCHKQNLNGPNSSGSFEDKKANKNSHCEAWLIKFQRGTRTLLGSRPVANWVIFYQRMLAAICLSQEPE